MDKERPTGNSDAQSDGKQAVHREGAWKRLALDFGGAIIFAFPLLMTMEMWWLGFYMDRLRLALFLFLSIPLVFGIAYYLVLDGGHNLKHDILDTFIAYAAAFTTAATILFLISVIEPGMPLSEIIGKVSLQAVPAGIGAVLAERQFGGGEEQRAARRGGGLYSGQLFFMLVGAFFLSFTVAPTEEMVLIGARMDAWQAVGLAVFSLLLMQIFMYVIELQGKEKIAWPALAWRVFLRSAVTGYAIALLISFYMLWSFGRTEGESLGEVIRATIVLAFPASLGASGGRLIL
jgi:putative integral membrane protein (TIGR02587 family)